MLGKLEGVKEMVVVYGRRALEHDGRWLGLSSLAGAHHF